MMNQTNLKAIRPLLILFVAINAFLIAGKSMLAKWGVDQEVLIIGNLLMFLVSFFSFIIIARGVNSVNPHAFLRSMYGSFIIKFFVIAIAAFVYIQVVKKQVNKPALFASMGLYIVYTFIEVRTLVRLLKQQKNA